jgi:hypothetical protein
MRALMLAFSLCAVALTAGAQQKKIAGERFKITKDEITETPSNIMTAAEVINQLRPFWLRQPMGREKTGGGGSATGLVVYIDGLRQNSVDDLGTVRREDIVEMKFLDANRAIGLRGNEWGAIEVTTVRKR